MPGSMRRAEYDGRLVLLPRVDQIRSGDILLTFNSESDDQKGMKQSRLIRAVTKGTFSHALICSTPPVFVEAIGTGVSTLSLARCFAHNIANVRLLRYPDPQIARHASQLAQDEIGRDYSVARAVRSVFPSDVLDRVDDHGIFCSALVAQAYTVAGSNIFRQVPADRTTPATIERLQGLENVTTLAFRSALAPNNIEEMSALDGDRAPTPSAQMTALSAECARQLWPQADALARAYPELELSPGPTFYALLRFVTGVIDRRERIHLDRQEAFMDSVMTLDRALASFISEGKFQAVLGQIIAQDGATIARNISESFKEQADIDLEGMKSFLAAGRQQLTDRLKGIKAWEQWGPERSRALSAYLPIDRECADAIHRRNITLEEILERRGVRVTRNLGRVT